LLVDPDVAAANGIRDGATFSFFLSFFSSLFNFPLPFSCLLLSIFFAWHSWAALE
jgi:hypothetical protein